MKRALTKQFFVLIGCLLYLNIGQAQLVAIISYNGSTGDGIGFVATEAIPAGTVIYFTDREYTDIDNQFTEGEAVWSYTVPASGMAQGDVVTMTETGGSTNIFGVACTSGDCGTANVISGTISLASTSSEYVYAYSDTDTDPSNGITEIYSAIVSRLTFALMDENPSADFPDAIIVDGFPEEGDHREFLDANRGSLVTKADLEDPTNYDMPEVIGNQALSTTPFADINVNPISICPTIGTGSTTPSDPFCINATFDVAVTGLENMDMASNTAADYGIRFVTFDATTTNPYTGGMDLTTVPFDQLSDGGTAAQANDLSVPWTSAGTYVIYAVLSPTPADAGCRPASEPFLFTVESAAMPAIDGIIVEDCGDGIGTDVTLRVVGELNGAERWEWTTGTATGEDCADLSSTFSGQTFITSFDEASLSNTYYVRATGGCLSEPVCFAYVPAELIGAQAELTLANTTYCVNVGVQNGLGGGTPIGGIYSGPGVTDGGNGMTFSFDPLLAGIGPHTITYTVSDSNIDQEQPQVGVTVSLNAERLAQSFVPSDDQLCGAGVFMADSGASGEITLSVWDNFPSEPGANLLVERTITTPSGDYADAIWPAVNVTPGNTYYLVIDDTNPQIGVNGSFGDPYPNGTAYDSNFNPLAPDLTFRTFSCTGTICTSEATAQIEVFEIPTVTFMPTIMVVGVDAGVQTSIGGGSPVGGVYSGLGVTDDGNGTTFSFDPAVAGEGVATITYSFTNMGGCSAQTDGFIAVTEPSDPEPGDSCDEALDISALFGQAFNEPQISDLFDNGAFTLGADDPPFEAGCFFEEDPFQNTGFFSFTGDGNTYRMRNIQCTSPDATLDLQVIIYSGACGDLTRIGCNEDEDANNFDFNFSIEFPTEEGVEYIALIDGYQGTSGEFCLEVTNLTEPMVLPGDECEIAIDIDDLFGQEEMVPQLSAEYDNTDYTDDPDLFLQCVGISLPPEVKTIWYSFTGDGNRYTISSANNGNPSNDIFGVLYEGTCDTLTEIACSTIQEGIPDFDLELQTEEGVEYSLLVFHNNPFKANTFNIEITNLGTVGVQDIRNTEFNIYPNPTTGQVQLDGFTADQIEVLDQLGRTVRTQPQAGTGIDLAGLPAGVYVLRMRVGTEVYSAKVVKK